MQRQAQSPPVPSGVPSDDVQWNGTMYQAVTEGRRQMAFGQRVRMEGGAGADPAKPP